MLFPSYCNVKKLRRRSIRTCTDNTAIYAKHDGANRDYESNVVMHVQVEGGCFPGFFLWLSLAFSRNELSLNVYIGPYDTVCVMLNACREMVDAFASAGTVEMLALTIFLLRRIEKCSPSCFCCC